MKCPKGKLFVDKEKQTFGYRGETAPNNLVIPTDPINGGITSSATLPLPDGLTGVVTYFSMDLNGFFCVGVFEEKFNEYQRRFKEIICTSYGSMEECQEDINLLNKEMGFPDPQYYLLLSNNWEDSSED